MATWPTFQNQFLEAAQAGENNFASRQKGLIDNLAAQYRQNTQSLGELAGQKTAAQANVGANTFRDITSNVNARMDANFKKTISDMQLRAADRASTKAMLGAIGGAALSAATGFAGMGMMSDAIKASGSSRMAGDALSSAFGGGQFGTINWGGLLQGGS